jgi:hypothetical protein
MDFSAALVGGDGELNAEQKERLAKVNLPLYKCTCKPVKMNLTPS